MGTTVTLPHRELRVARPSVRGGGAVPRTRPGPCPPGEAAGQVLLSRVGLKLPATVTYEGWAKAGIQIARVADSSAWCLGDWLICGQNKYQDRYRLAIAEAGLDYQTLRNYAWVARRFELPRRREQLSFQHHAEVASLPGGEQDRWLDEAERQRWSRNRLRESIRQARTGTRDPRPSRGPALPKVSAPREQVQRWQEAAEREGVNFEKWILSVLDNAACHALGRMPGGELLAMLVDRNG
jgi:hypothetical protein